MSAPRIIAAALAIAALTTAAPAAQPPPAGLSKPVTIQGTQGPWFFMRGPRGTNADIPYGVGDQSMPEVISNLSGFDFKPGALFTVKYVRGSVTLSADGRYRAPNASGSPSLVVNDSSGSSGDNFPSAFFDRADYPAHLGALTGAFADGLGEIIGKPFLIGNARSFKVPAGATRLELGINDDVFLDNSGSFNVIVSQPGTRPPAAAPPVLASAVKWAGGIFGAVPPSQSCFLIMASGFFMTTTSPDIPAIEAQWLKTHPKAHLVNVSCLGQMTDKNPNSIGIYVWVVDGDACLNLELVRQGCIYPGSQAMSPGEELLVPRAAYDAFLEKVLAAGTDAKAKKLRIWTTNPDGG
jgi:hypothetical protein